MADILFQCEQQGTLGVIYTARVISFWEGVRRRRREKGRQTTLSSLEQIVSEYRKHTETFVAAL